MFPVIFVIIHLLAIYHGLHLPLHSRCRYLLDSRPQDSQSLQQAITTFRYQSVARSQRYVDPNPDSRLQYTFSILGL